MRYRRDRYRRGYRTDYGYERAQQHIREGQELSRQLGGTDKDVKAYFFSLSRSELAAVLAAYELEYGWEKRDYAERTLADWRSGARQMSGLVAGRLFDLLPPRMPFDKKYDLVANLWREMGPSSHKILRIGMDAMPAQIIAAVELHVMTVVQSYSIPERLQKRFGWLTAGDVHVKEQLLNALRDMERRQTVDLCQLQIPTMLSHMRQHADKTQRLAQVLEIGKHKVELLYDSKSSGVTPEEPSFSNDSSAAGGNGYAWVPWIIIGIVIVYLLSR